MPWSNLPDKDWARCLAFAQLVLAIFSLTIGSACTGINAGQTQRVCTFATGVWVGLLSVFCAIIGLISGVLSPYQRTLRNIYFGLCLLLTVSCVILLAISAVWIDRASSFYSNDGRGYELTSVVLNVCLLIIAAIQMICTATAITVSIYKRGLAARQEAGNA